jgi:hypothetical protein
MLAPLPIITLFRLALIDGGTDKISVAVLVATPAGLAARQVYFPASAALA